MGIIVIKFKVQLQLCFSSSSLYFMMFVQVNVIASFTDPNIKSIKLEKVALEERIEFLEQRLNEYKNQIKQNVLLT